MRPVPTVSSVAAHVHPATDVRTVNLRRWQKTALDAFHDRVHSDFLAVATPGAGKTTLALVAARQNLAARSRRKLIVVAPTQHLKGQWADAAEALDLQLETSWNTRDGMPPADSHGLVTTYQQVAASAASFRSLADDAFVVLDEVHHAGDDRAWGEGVTTAFAGAFVRLCLSGTPFRSDTRAIPFVRYDDDGMAQPDIEYGYGEALTDRGVVRPVRFPRMDGEMEWIEPDGSNSSASFEDALDSARSSRRLRTALSTDGEWLPHVLRRAHRQLLDVRRGHPGAAGLVIAIDQNHARAIAEVLRRVTGVAPVLVVSEDPDASQRIARFTHGTDAWLVAVRMVSEGVDIPRLRVGVFASTTTTELFFRQAVGRLVRWTRGLGPQPSYMFIPDDPRLRAHAFAITKQRRHSLRTDGSGEGLLDEPLIDELVVSEALDEQLSLFSAVSAVAVGAPSVHRVEDALPAMTSPREDDEGVPLDLDPLPRFASAADRDNEPPPGGYRKYRSDLRDANAALARSIAQLTGLSHAQVNGELNRRVGLGRITEATVTQLERRRDQATAWLRTA